MSPGPIIKGFDVIKGAAPGRIASRKSAFGLFTNPPPLEVFATSATRSALCSGSFAQHREVVIMRSLRQIVPEATGSVAIALAERIRIGLFQGRETWEKR
jgi:hypothetical protein